MAHRHNVSLDIKRTRTITYVKSCTTSILDGIILGGIILNGISLMVLSLMVLSLMV